MVQMHAHWPFVLDHWHTNQQKQKLFCSYCSSTQHGMMSPLNQQVYFNYFIWFERWLSDYFWVMHRGPVIAGVSGWWVNSMGVWGVQSVSRKESRGACFYRYSCGLNCIMKFPPVCKYKYIHVNEECQQHNELFSKICPAYSMTVQLGLTVIGDEN